MVVSKVLIGIHPYLENLLLEIKLLGNDFKRIPFDAIYSSDSKRAKDTARLLVESANISLPITYSKA